MVMTEDLYVLRFLPPIACWCFQLETFVQSGTKLDTRQDADFVSATLQGFGLIQTEQTSVRGEERRYLKYVHWLGDVLVYAKV